MIKKAEKRDRIIVGMFPIATILLLVALYGTYMSRITERHLLLPSYERYVLPIVIGIIMTLFVICFKYLLNSQRERAGIIILGGFAIICSICFGFSESENYFKVVEQEHNRYAAIADRLLLYTEEGTTIYVISQGNLGDVAYHYKYQLIAQRVVTSPLASIAPISVTKGETVISSESGTPEYTQCSTWKFRRIVEKNNVDYILVDYTDKELQEGYGELFSDGLQTGHFWDAKLYRVNKETNQYEFVGLISEE